MTDQPRPVPVPTAPTATHFLGQEDSALAEYVGHILAALDYPDEFYATLGELDDNPNRWWTFEGGPTLNDGTPVPPYRTGHWPVVRQHAISIAFDIVDGRHDNPGDR